MINLKILIILRFLLISNKLLCVRVHTEFGDYKHRINQELWHTDCGLRHVPKDRKSLESNKCFKLKTPLRQLMATNGRSTSDTSNSYINTRIKNNEYAGEGEAPWSVYLECGGVILNKKWILTAAHCLTNEVKRGNITAGNNNRSKGTQYSVQSVWKHRNYNDKRKIDNKTCLYDIGLIKINGEIEFKIVNNRYVTNSVCLPKKGIRNERKEFATMYSWGLDSNSRDSQPDLLHKGNFLLHDSRNCWCYCSDSSGNDSNPAPITCVGDSGSGLVQFLGPKNRAVVIGIASTTDPSLDEQYYNCGSLGASFAVVSEHIDWILKIMKEN